MQNYLVFRIAHKLKNHEPSKIEEGNGVKLYTYHLTHDEIHEVNEIGKIIQFRIH